MREITINQNDAGQRLDKFLTKYLVNMPQSMLYKSLRKNCVRVNGKHIKDGKYMLQNGDVLKLFFKDEFYENKSSFKAGNSDIDVVYEDENIILINKESGVVVHSDDKGTKDTLLERMQSYLYKKGNRLDRNTSGIIIGAKNAAALRIINEKIRSREIKKIYLCIVEGHLKKSGHLTAYLTRGDKKVTVSDYHEENSKKIGTKYNVIAEKKDTSLVEVELETGRTHQIRAQFSHIGNPLYGDTKYGSRHSGGMKLASYKLVFDFKTDAGILNYLNHKEFQISVDFAKTFAQQKL